MAKPLIKLANVNEFLEKLSNENCQNDELLSFISNIEWNFLNNVNNDDIENAVTKFADILLNLSQNTQLIPRLCEVVVKYLNISPRSTNKNFKPFILLIWNLYFLNPTLKEYIQFAISRLFPHYVGLSVEMTTVYVTNLLSLVSNDCESFSSLTKYKEYNDIFIKDMQYFVLEEIVNYIIKFDDRLILKDFQITEANKSSELNNQISKMDKLMCLIFNFIFKNIHETDLQLNWTKTQELFKIVKRIYKNKILFYNMPNSLFHVHYILAYMTSFHSNLSKHACEYLWTLATDEDQPIGIQCAAARSLAGYVAKFNFIGTNLTLVILSEVFAWCNDYLNNSLSIGENQDHQIFHCIANAGLFILLHRYREIVNFLGSVSKFSAYAETWQLSYLTMHKINMLKEFPNRELLPKLCELFRECYLGYIDTIIEEKVVRKAKPTLLVGMPFRYYFLKDSMAFLDKLRVSGEKQFH